LLRRKRGNSQTTPKRTAIVLLQIATAIHEMGVTLGTLQKRVTTPQKLSPRSDKGQSHHGQELVARARKGVTALSTEIQHISY